MKKFFKFLPLALAAITVVSCSNDDELFGDAQGKKYSKTLQVNVAEPVTDANVTRAALYINDEKKNVVTWQKGDAFRVYDALLQKYDEYEYQTDKFATSDENVETPKYSLFPANLVSYSGWKNKVGLYAVYELQSELTYSEIDITKNEKNYIAYESNIPMFGQLKEESTVQELKAEYVYLTGILKIRLYNGENKVKSIKVESLKENGSTANTNMPLSGYFNAVLDAENKFLTDVNKSMLVKSDEPIVAASYDTKISVNVDNFIENQESYVYIPIVPGTYPNLKISYKKADDTEVELATLVNKEIKAGHLYAKNDVKETMEIVNTADVNVDGSIVPEDLTELLAKNTGKEGIVSFNINKMVVNNADYVKRYTVYVPNMKADKVVLNFTTLDNVVEDLEKLQFIYADEGDAYEGELEIKVGTLTATKALPININLPSTSVQFVGDFVPKNAAAITITDVKTVTFGDEDARTTKIGDLTLTKVAKEINVMEGAELTKGIALPGEGSSNITLNVGGKTGAIAAKKATTNAIGAAYITTLTTSGDVTVNVEKFPGAAITNLNMNGSNPVLNLKSGYIKVLSSAAATVENPRTITINNEETGPTAINSVGTPDNVTFSFNTSKWAGKKATGPYANLKNIYTASQLASVTGSLDGGYKLENNIDLNNLDWTAIASLTVEFDGNKKTISNLKGKQGLFSAISADVKNLTLSNFAITPETEVAGAVAGTVSAAATLTDITVTDLTITGAGANGCKLGGLVGTNSAKLTIAGASVAGDIKGYSNLGGLLGYAGADVDIKKGTTIASVASTVSFTANHNSASDYDIAYAQVGRFIGSVKSDATVVIVDATDADQKPSITTSVFGGKIQLPELNLAGTAVIGYNVVFGQYAIGYSGKDALTTDVKINTKEYKIYATKTAYDAVEGMDGSDTKEFALYYINK